jgi:small-conductance mechanosensitive channel
MLNSFLKFCSIDISFENFISDLEKKFIEFWNVKVFTTSDNQPILLSNLVVGIIWLIIGIILVNALSRLIRSKLAKIVKEENTLNLLAKVIYYFMLTILLIIVLDIADVPLTIFTVVGTTLALGIGLGSQNLANNFISGIIISLEKPIKLGDVIEFKDILGRVVSIGARSTCIKTETNVDLLIPNSIMLQDPIFNLTHTQEILNLNVEINLSNNISLSEIENILNQALSEHNDIVKKPAPCIFLTKLTKDYNTFELSFYVNAKSGLQNKKIINDLYRRIAIFLKERSIQIF